MVSDLSNQTLSGRTVLCSPTAHGEFPTELRQHGARVLTWPAVDVGEPENYESLDEAIDNLFGYDWLIFQNLNAVNFFLSRLHLRHEISELDALRVCGVGEAVVHQLEQSQIHIDVIPADLSSPAIFDAIETFVGGRAPLRGLNFLVPVGSSANAYLQEALENAGARVDRVPAYRTCLANNPKLAQITALITGGGIDCIAFAHSTELHEFAGLFDTNDLGRLLAGAPVACMDGLATAQAANELGLIVDIVIRGADAQEMAQAIALYFRAD